MTTRPRDVVCPWCGAQPHERCTTPAPPGKKLRARAPLRLTESHPSRVAAAMKLDGANEAEVERRVTAELSAAALKYRELPGREAAPEPPTRGEW